MFVAKVAVHGGDIHQSMANNAGIYIFIIVVLIGLFIAHRIFNKKG